ncbi:MAG: metalloregulator ArsR/SmtB family transcription factor [Candidatus Nanopelagicales bacterium]|nr:metalloregulator ArsR/SmtB family transcription factor [Candidatus Nanopelagicales bacterium]
MDRSLQVEIHELHARLCKAIADPKRLMIITELRSGPMTVNDLALALDLSQSNTSQHLAILRERGIVHVERDGLNSYYSLRSKKVLRAIDLLREFMAEDLIESSTLRKAAGKIPAASSRR